MSQKTFPSLLIASALLATLAASGVEAKVHPYSQAFETQISKLFFEAGSKGQQISTSKTDAYIQRLKQKQSEVRSLLAGKAKMKGKKADPKDLDEESVVVALGLAASNLEQAKKTSDLAKQADLIQSALDLEAAVRMEGERPTIIKYVNYAKAALSTWSVPKSSQAADEASNLYDSSSKSYLSVEQLAALKARGADLAAYGPGPKSDFWSKPASVSGTDVERAGLGKTMEIYKDFAGFPASNVFEYDEMKLSSTKPKMQVFVKDSNGKKQKFKIKLGAELHADPTVSALMMTLGYPSDITKYAKNVRVNLGKTKLEDVKKDWESYYLRDGEYKIEKYISSSGQDKNGDNYVVFAEASIEADPKKVDRVGGWAWADNSHSSLREVRALTLVSMWLDNSDLKEFDNNKLLLIEKDGSYQKKLIISDVGHSLGWLWLEAPDRFAWKMVTSTSGSNIDFQYRAVQKASIKDKITFADARWATRLIADLSREQIAKAVAFGGWPSCVQPIYVEKMISRRNDLVKTFGLIGEKSIDGKTIALMPVKNTDKDRDALKYDNACGSGSSEKASIASFTSEFDLDMGSLLEPVAEAGWQGLKSFAAQAISGPKKIVLSSKRFRNFDPGIISEILVDVRRDIERNPNPTSVKDTYVVRDHFEVGMRLGVSFGAFKDVVYSRRYSLAYPVRSMEEGRGNNGFLVNLMLAKDISKGELPEQYVLKTEHFRSHGVGVDILAPTAGLVRADIDAGISKVLMWRSIYDHRDPAKYVLYRDRTSGGEKFLEVSARVLIMKLPVFREAATWGKAVGKGVMFSEADLNADKARGTAVWKAVTHGDFEGLAKNEKLFYATNEFKGGLRRWSFLAWGESREKRLDRVEIESDENVKSSVQYRSSKEVRFSLFGDKRKRNVSVDVYANAKNPKDFQINVGVMNLDVSTSDKDMTNYIAFVNGLGTDSKKLIALTPGLNYTVNGKWGSTLLKSDTEYSAAAVQKIMALTASQYYTALAATIGKSPAQMKLVIEAEKTGNDKNATKDEKEIVEKSREFLKRLADAIAEKKESSRLKKLAEAFRKTIFADSHGFYNSSILGALNRVAGDQLIYSRNVITVPPFSEMTLLESAPLFGEVGQPLATNPQYLVFSPTSALELYTMFDTWF